MRVMNSTLKRRKSIDSQAASISAWCAVFDWPSIVAAFSVSRHGPASSSAARRNTAARSSHGQRDQSSHAAAAASIASLHVLGAALVHVGEHVLLVVRHDRLLELSGRHVLAADHERDLDALVAHLLDAPLQALALGAAGRVVVDRLVAGGGRTEDRVGAHARRLRGVDLSHVLWIGGGQGSGKSSVAWALSRRFDLQLYNVDRRTWVHEARMPTTEFGMLSDGRAVGAADARADAGLVRHDLAASLPPRARGSPRRCRTHPDGDRRRRRSSSRPRFRPCCRAPDQALFLGSGSRRAGSTAAWSAGRCPGRPTASRARANATARDLLISARFAREARELRLTAFPADRPLAELIELAAEQLRAGDRAWPARGRSARRCGGSRTRSTATTGAALSRVARPDHAPGRAAARSPANAARPAAPTRSS